MHRHYILTTVCGLLKRLGLTISKQKGHRLVNIVLRRSGDYLPGKREGFIMMAGLPPMMRLLTTTIIIYL